MLTPQVYKKLIVNGIEDLPPDLLAEIANFVFFLRKQAVDPAAFAEEQYALLVGDDLAELHQDEWQHLETEVTDYDKRFPRR